MIYYLTNETLTPFMIYCFNKTCILQMNTLMFYTLLFSALNQNHRVLGFSLIQFLIGISTSYLNPSHPYEHKFITFPIIPPPKNEILGILSKSFKPFSNDEDDILTRHVDANADNIDISIQQQQCHHLSHPYISPQNFQTYTTLPEE